MLNNLKRLCSINGISGREGLVREEIIRQISSECSYEIDPLGNILAFKKGRKTPKNKILVSAHMDEVGMIVTGITAAGTVKFSTVGGVDPRVIIGRAVIIEDSVKGVVGAKAIHLQNGEERTSAVTLEQLYIDVGAKDEKDASRHIKLGGAICFCGEYTEFGSGRIKAKAIDDRFGCAVIIELIKSELEYDTHFSFVVQEEVGLRGARTAAYGVAPDIAIVVESTTAADLAGVETLKKVCELGEGPVVPFMDLSTIYDEELYKLTFETAKKNGIPCQTKTAVAGGNDAGAISVAGNGVRTISVSIPCRYLHSPCCVIDERDAKNTLELVKLLPGVFAEI